LLIILKLSQSFVLISPHDQIEHISLGGHPSVCGVVPSHLLLVPTQTELSKLPVHIYLIWRKCLDPESCVSWIRIRCWHCWIISWKYGLVKERLSANRAFVAYWVFIFEVGSSFY
jgi:hypothetical protein